MFQFAWLWVFLFLPLPLLVYFFSKPKPKEKTAVVVPFYDQVIEASSTQGKIVNSNLVSLILLSLIWLLFIAAAARPQWVGEAIALPNSGRDLLIAVDISDSMEQNDMVMNGLNVSRLIAVKKVVSEFIERRQGDRIGLVLFGTNAYLQTPLTFDTKTVAQFLIEAQLGFAGPKTAIGDAIGLSVKRLRELQNQDAERVLILLTDGANTAGEVSPLQAAELAAKTDVKIYTVGIGADEMVVKGFFGPRRINPSAQLDEKTLISIAETTGGQYFRARETDQLDQIYKELDKLEPTEDEQEWLRPTRSLFYWPLGLALALSALLASIYIRPFSSRSINKEAEA
jgi:Ca-activated chloride channel family protein